MRMRNYAEKGLGWLGGMFLAGILVFDGRAQAPQNTGAPTDVLVVLEFEGSVQLLRAGAATWDPVMTNHVLRVGDQLRTGERSRALVQKSGLAAVRVGEYSVLRLDPPAKGRGVLHLLKGVLFFFHRSNPGDAAISTPMVSAVVRGTEFGVNVDDDGTTTVSLIDGVVDLTNSFGALTIGGGDVALVQPGAAPVRTAAIDAVKAIQWSLYYPGVLDLDELGVSNADAASLAESFAAYRTGDLLHAMATYPAARRPASPSEMTYLAAVLLSVGNVAQADELLTSAALASGEASIPATKLANALRRVIAAVQNTSGFNDASPELATEWMAESYCQQSRGNLRAALAAAERAVAKSPKFGFGWVRLAEMQFSFGRTPQAVDALEKGLAFSPRNAQAHALKGFLLSAQNRTAAAIAEFEQAIALDGALGNAWVGRGLCKIKLGRAAAGRADLLVAATLEPQRAVVRSYLGKAFSNEGDAARAAREIALAQKLDPRDPTSWLYSALLHQQNNRLNEALRDLEKSRELNDQRAVYRSGLLLDQDRAVRSANLARIYADVGFSDVALREAARATAADYGNFAAHLFLSDSYSLARRATANEQRFETPAFSEYLLANLLGPADGRLLAQPVTQQEYSRLFERNGFGLSTSTEYLSRGAWSQYAAQYGTWERSSYAIEADYRWDPGETMARNLESRAVSFKFKQMLTPQDGLYFQVIDLWKQTGDLSRRYDPNQAVAGLRSVQKQQPSLILGLDHQWSESQRTLVVASRFDSTSTQMNPRGPTLLVTETFGVADGFVRQDLTQSYRSRFTVNSVEMQHLIRMPQLQTIAGVRLQSGTDRLANLQTIEVGNAPNFEIYFGNPGDIVSAQSSRLHSLRVSPYLYEHWQVCDQLWLIAGVSYDYQSQPRNAFFAPLGDGEEIHRQLSPKAALIWNPTARATVRAAFSRSLGGFDLDQSVRIEPTQLAGFVQSYRGLFPDSLVGSIAGARMETADLSLEYNFPSGTYAAIAGQFLRSRSDHDVGGFQRDLFTSAGPAIQIHERLRYQERSLEVSLRQLLGDMFAVGIRYRGVDSRLAQSYPGIDPALGTTSSLNRGFLNSVRFDGVFRHPCGFFAGADAEWWAQNLSADLSGTPGADLWQVNLVAGYRFPRRHAELAVGVLNVTDRDYRLHPVNLHPDLPRERTLFVRLQLNF